MILLLSLSFSIFVRNYFDMKNHAFFQVHICAQLNTPTLTLTVTAPPSRRYDTLMLTKGQLNINIPIPHIA